MKIAKLIFIIRWAAIMLASVVLTFVITFIAAEMLTSWAVGDVTPIVRTGELCLREEV